MPVILAIPSDTFRDVMVLASSPRQSVLIAILYSDTGMLRFLHLSPPNPVLQNVEADDAQTPIRDLFDRAEQKDLLTFRAHGWKSSAVAYLIPEI